MAAHRLKNCTRLSGRGSFLVPDYETMPDCILQKRGWLAGLGPKAGKSSSTGKEKIKAWSVQ